MGWVLGILCTCLGMQAQQYDRLPKGAQTQTYNRLWKEVEQLEQKDLPQSVMAAVQQIYERAEREQNRPQLWKAYLTRMHYRALVAPDSLEVDLRMLEQRARQSASADERAILFSFLGEWTLQTAVDSQGSQQEAVLQKGLAFLEQSLLEKEALLQVSAAHWQPLTESGETSRLYFQDNLYDLLARRALDFFDRYRWQAASLGNQTEQLPTEVKNLPDFRHLVWEPQSTVDGMAAKFRLYQSMLTAYENGSLPSAFLLTALQAMRDLHLSFPQQFPAEAYERQLEHWCTNGPEEIFWKGSDARQAAVSALAEVWLTRAEWLFERQRYGECRQVIREALRRYPRFVRANRLRNLEQRILLPALSLVVEPAYPGELHPLRLSYKNLKGFTLQLYKVDLPVTSPALRERVESFERKHARLQREETFTLSPTSDYRLKDTLLYFQAPQPGVYWLKAVPHGEQGKVQGKAQGELLFVTSLQALHRCLPDGKTEWVVVDGQSGHPVPGAELVTYVEMGGGYRPMQTYSTDAQGTLLLDIRKPQSMLYRVRTPQDDAMPVSSLWANGCRQAPETRSKEQLQLFTDRSLYRPGQAVYVSGLAYQQLHDATQVWPDRSYIVTLMDVNGSEVGRQTVTTNSFGSFQTQFTLPSTGLTGRFTLKAVNASSGAVASEGVRVSTDIRVEAYKRPTFEVTFEPVKESYQVGDSLRLKGVARTFSGAPVQQAKVRYVVSRSTSYWWRRPGSGQARWEGEALTDAEGRFEVPVHFQVDASVHPSVTKSGASRIASSQTPASQWYYTYQVAADVTDGAGESHQGECTLPLASVSLRMQVENVSDRWVKEKLTPIRMGVYSLTGEPLDKEVHFEIVELKETASQSLRPSEESLCPSTGKLRSSVGQLRQTVWDISAAPFQEGAVVARGTLRSNCDTVPEAVKTLSAGRYRWKASATDAQGRRCTATFDFLLFSQQAQRPPVPVMDWFYPEGQEFDAEAVPTLSVGSSASEVYLFYDVFAGNRRVESRRVVFSDSVLHFRFPYREDYGEGILVQVAFWKDGRLYRHEATITQPRPDKRLLLKWRTFRDKLRPGQQEEWRLQVQYPDGRPAEAELLATMYDASLDPLFRRHQLPLQLSFARWLPTIGWEQTYRNTLYYSVDFPWKSLKYPYLSYSCLVGPEVREAVEVKFVPNSRSYRTGAVKRKNVAPQAMADRIANSLVVNGEVVQDVVFESEVIPLSGEGLCEEAVKVAFGARGASQEFVAEEAVEEAAADAVLQALNGVSLRMNRQETAFFYPQLRTDAQGEVSLSFVLPESLTRWRFLGLAHTRSVDYGMLEAEVTARKEFMLQPALPRFVRVGDRTTVSASLVNLSAVAVKGKVRLELFDPMTERVLFRQKQPFAVEAGATGQVTFAFPVKEGTDVLACRMVAEGGTFSDGEQQYLPVLSNQQWVTETYPLYLNGAGRKTVALDSLFNHHSPTASGHRLTVEWTAQPLWYAVQALPVLADPCQDDAMDWAAAYYATSLADVILRTQPRIRSVLEAWKMKEAQASVRVPVSSSLSSLSFSSSLASALTQNEELKNLLLEETPWIGDAQHQTEQRRQVATLFDANTLHSRLALALEKLRELQREDGSWSWYKGMAGSRLVTTQVLELLARLQTLSGQSLPDAARRMFQQGLDYLKKEVQTEYQQLKEAERKGKKPQLPSESAVRYLYLCVLSEGEQQSAMQRYFLDRLPQWGAGNAIYQKALAAVVLQGYGRTQEAREQLQSVLEYSVYTDEQGRYFDTPKALHTWRNYQLPTQVMALEALQRLTPEASAIDEMKRWLLKQKQVQAWESSVATADAVFALLMGPSKAVSKKISSEKTASSSEMAVSENAVSEKAFSEKVAASDLTASGSNRVTVRLGSFEMQTPVDEALGYQKQSWQEKGVAAVRQVVVEQTGSGSSWGAVYAQYRESLDKVQAQSQGVTVTRRWLRDGQEVRDENAPLQVGDRLVVELTITADRNLDFVQLKDERAACLEPVETLSGYRWNGKVGYYQASRDASTSFFFDRLPKGTYTVTYPVYVTRRGTYQSGLASVQSAYAPAFGGHTEARSMVVE